MNKNPFAKAEHRANPAALREQPLTASPHGYTADKLALLKARIVALCPVPTKAYSSSPPFASNPLSN
ncbi:MAG: hypothetical protein ACJAY7_000959 [Pseudohongiellaceae bacterium]|jgi:hypothetical protein